MEMVEKVALPLLLPNPPSSKPLFSNQPIPTPNTNTPSPPPIATLIQDLNSTSQRRRTTLGKSSDPNRGKPWSSHRLSPPGIALHALRSRLSDPNNVLQSWDPTLVNSCTWFHVTCDSNNHVIRLDLGNANVSGTLGPELAHLPYLQYLELYRNDISGEIPKELGQLKNLISMDLYDNKLQGKIPKSFGKLNSIKFLRLNNNKLTGSIPRELTHLKNLEIFDVSNNDLCGTIPVDGNFKSFPVESFENNRLNGPELKGLVPYDFGC